MYSTNSMVVDRLLEYKRKPVANQDVVTSCISTILMWRVYNSDVHVRDVEMDNVQSFGRLKNSCTNGYTKLMTGFAYDIHWWVELEGKSQMPSWSKEVPQTIPNTRKKSKYPPFVYPPDWHLLGLMLRTENVQRGIVLAPLSTRRIPRMDKAWISKQAHDCRSVNTKDSRTYPEPRKFALSGRHDTYSTDSEPGGSWNSSAAELSSSSRILCRSKRRSC